LCVAQIRAIFTLPPQFGRYDHPLSYIEWFTPLGRVDAATHLHTIKRSTRNNRRRAAIIGVDQIVRDAHLIGKCGAKVPVMWGTDNILDTASTFMVNRYIDITTFMLLSS
jgi:hypothetical protein